MKCVVFNHQDKARAFMNALGDECEEYNGSTGYNFALIDNDVFGRGKLERLKRSGCNLFFVYPHDAGPNLTNDVYPVWEHTTACLVATEGHREVLKLYNYPKPIHVIGWHLCQIKDFEPTEGRKVLFAPIHPRCDEVDQAANRKAFNALKKLAVEGKIELTVRYLTSLEGSGLRKIKHDNITYFKGNAEPAVFQIDHADVVIGHLTFAYLAVARGKPTIFFGSDIPHHQVPKDEPPQYAQNWNYYKGLLRFPYDLGDTNDPMAMIKDAAKSDERIIHWRSQMIGGQFDPDTFKSILFRYLPELKKDKKMMSDRKRALYRLRYGEKESTWPP